MVIVIPVRKYPCRGLLNFLLQPTFAKKCQQRVMTIEPLSAEIPASAHFPKFVLRRGTHFQELRKVMGTSKPIASSAAFLFEVPGSNAPLVVQELQIGGAGCDVSGPI
jgi:hypothetical protein